MKKIIYILIALLLVACGSSKRITKTTTQKTVVEKEHIISYKDTTFIVPKKTATITFPKQLIVHHYDTITRTIVQRNGHATAKVIIERDTVLITAECDTILLTAKIKKELIKSNTNTEAVRVSDKQRTTGVPVLKAVLYGIAIFVLGFMAGYLSKFLNKINLL